MKPPVKLLLNDILLCSEKAVEIKAKIAAKDSSKSSDEGMAMCGCFSRIAVLMKSIPEEVKAKHPEIEWTAMMKFGNQLVERYWETDMLKVAEAVENQLPKLRASLLPLVQVLEN